MTSRIYTLPEDVVYRIAAGEVIDSLAAVVRELAENALDAEATRIAISIWTEQWRVRVADNGRGMELIDLKQAALPHSTSKIRDGRDLWQVTSLGFRGEALHSLAQLADLEICSRWSEGDEGWQIRYDSQGEPQQIEPIAIACGTIVTVSQLFGNWLPRRQGLPSFTQQLRSIQLIIAHLALCHPHITWQVEQNDRPWFTLWASPSPQHLLPQLLRGVQPGDFLEWQGGEGLTNTAPGSAPDLTRDLTQEQDLAQDLTQEPTEEIEDSFPLILTPPLYLLMGLPDRCHRHRPDWVKVAVNGRMVKFPELEQVIFTALRRTLPRDRHPVCFLHLQLPPSQIDWNRHPAKAEIYIHHLEHWQTQIAAAIAQALRLNPASVAETAYTRRVGQLIRAAESAGAYGQEPSASDDSADSSPSDLSDPIAATSDPLLSLKALAQVHQMYILAEHPSGMWLVEQHIAHERVLYEQLCDRWQLVELEPPVILHQLAPVQIEQLQRIGIAVEPFGEQRWAVRTAPEPLAQRSDCADALLELSLGGNLEAAIVATACRTAIRNGTPLTLEEMQSLVNQWLQTRNPRTCPHGRPIYLQLEESSLSRFFRRHWVIGKSHGI